MPSRHVARGMLGLLAVASLGVILCGAWTQREAAPLDDALFAATLLNALAYWAVCTFAFGPRLALPAVRAIHACFLLTAFAVATGDIAPWRTTGEAVLRSIFILSIACMPVTFLDFSVRFPRPLPSLARRAWILASLYGVALLLAAWNIHAWGGFAGSARAGDPEAQLLPERALLAWFVLVLTAGIVALFGAARRAQRSREKRQVKWVLWGIAIGATPYVFLRVVPRLLWDMEPIPSPIVDRLVELTVPIAFTFAVVRERAFDIDVIIRRSVLYTVAAMLIAALFGAWVLLLGSTVIDWVGAPATWLWGLSGALAVAVFVAARQTVARWVDRTFFKLRFGHEQTLAALREELASAGSRGELGERLAAFVARTMEIRACAVTIPHAEGWLACGDLPGAGDLALALDGDPADDRPRAAPDAAAGTDLEGAPLPDATTAAGVRLVQPIMAGDRRQGLLWLGEKASGRHYVEEDLRLLAALALQAGRALERTALLERVVAEAMAKKQIQDLSNQKSEFFARVAHDLRTPLTAIQWSVRNLREGLAGPLGEKQAAYLESVAAAERQLGRLVDNLVDLSRLELRDAPPAPRPVDLRDAIDEVLLALRPVAQERNAGFAVRAAEGLAPIRGRPEGVMQVVMNLVDNALKYNAPGEDIEIEARAAGEDRVELVVRDHGPGLPAEGRGHLFDLFHQGPESPHAPGKGFGIGLHIVKAWIDAMDGAIEATDHADGGALFRVTLPTWHASEDAA